MVSFCDGFVVSLCNDALWFLKHVTKYVNHVLNACCLENVNDVVQWKIFPKRILNKYRWDGTSHMFLET